MKYDKVIFKSRNGKDLFIAYDRGDNYYNWSNVINNKIQEILYTTNGLSENIIDGYLYLNIWKKVRTSCKECEG